MTNAQVRQIPKRGELSDVEHEALLQRVDEGDADARERLILHHRGLAVSVANAIYLEDGNNWSLEDHIQEAEVGLIKAVDGFKQDKGYKFSTYAMTVIRNHVNTQKKRTAYFVCIKSRGFPSGEHYDELEPLMKPYSTDGSSTIECSYGEMTEDKPLREQAFWDQFGEYMREFGGKLPPKESRVFWFIAHGYGVREVMEATRFTPKEIEEYKTRVLAKARKFLTQKLDSDRG